MKNRFDKYVIQFCRNKNESTQRINNAEQVKRSNNKKKVKRIASPDFQYRFAGKRGCYSYV